MCILALEKVAVLDLIQEEIDAPCGYCWHQTEFLRVIRRSGGHLGIFWIGQCECGTILFVLPKRPVDLLLELQQVAP